MKKDFSSQLEAFTKREERLAFTPPVIYLESVKGCPFSCVMCRHSFDQTVPKRMPMDLLKKIEPCFKDLEVMAVHGEGEPLMGDIKYYVEQSAYHDFVLHMNTTGFLLSRKLADLLLKTRLSIRFSIHAGRPETYTKIMGQDLSIVRKNVSYIVNKANLLGRSHDFWFSFIVMKENIDEVEDFFFLAKDCGIKSVRFERLIPNWLSIRGVKIKDHNFKFKYFEQSNNEIRNHFFKRLPKYQELAEELGIKIEFGSIFSSSKNIYPLKDIFHSTTAALFSRGVLPLFRTKGVCVAPWFGQMVINQKGNVRLCCNASFSLGNLNDSSLPEIWNSEKMQAIRRSFKEGYVPRECGYCSGFLFDDYPNNAFKTVERSRMSGFKN